ncbi:hypothetical protein GGH94_000381 [Coemansia aciculifera]|uniref:Uncharacterized protein n=1 Tax=Coemansia aciculifera TaxID=417176 RepID=A0A9W8M7E4_9FUNG|nr:hypothetical protein GGH94_000381 [Coemansia aciculifera]
MKREERYVLCHNMQEELDKSLPNFVYWRNTTIKKSAKHSLDASPTHLHYQLVLATTAKSLSSCTGYDYMQYYDSANSDTPVKCGDNYTYSVTGVLCAATSTGAFGMQSSLRVTRNSVHHIPKGFVDLSRTAFAAESLTEAVQETASASSSSIETAVAESTTVAESREKTACAADVLDILKALTRDAAEIKAWMGSRETALETRETEGVIRAHWRDIDLAVSAFPACEADIEEQREAALKDREIKVEEREATLEGRKTEVEVQ